MTLKRIDYERSFTAVDEDGNEHEIEIYVEILDAGHMQNPSAEEEGLRTLQTKQGEHVNRIEKGKYVILNMGTELTSNDPDAP